MNPQNHRADLAGRLRPYVLVILAIGFVQTYYLVLPYLGSLGDWVAYFALPSALLGLLWVWIRSEESEVSRFGWVFYERPFRTLAPVALFVGAYLAVVIEAGAFIGLRSQSLPSPLTASLLVSAAPIIALSQVGIFQGYFLRSLADRGHFLRALGLASLAYAFANTDLPLLTRLSVSSAGEYLFLTSGTAFALAVVLGVYVYKSRWSIAGPSVLQAVLLLIPFFFPLALGAGGWEFEFLVQIFAYSAILLMVVIFVREPGYLARRYLDEEFGPKRYRFLRRDRNRRSVRQLLVVGLAVVGVSCAGAIGLQAWSGTHTPLLAIATGSMTPTLVRGDLVLIQHAGPSQISVGDIIAYSGTCLPAPTVHRVISITEGANGPVYTTKGDANPSPDPCPVPYSEVDGKVVGILPAAGYLLLEPALFVGIAAIAILVPPIFRREAGGPRGIPQG